MSAASTTTRLRHISYAEAEQRLASDDSRQTLFLLIRHAESVWNVWEQLYEGKEPLLFDALFSPNGQQQLQQTRTVIHTLLKGRLPDVLILSPLSRAIETGLTIFNRKQTEQSTEQTEQTTEQTSTIQTEQTPTEQTSTIQTEQTPTEQTSTIQTEQTKQTEQTIDWHESDCGHQIVLSHLLRELLEDSCDVGTPPAVLKQRYPELDVEQLSRLGNHWFLPGRLHEIADRGPRFDGDVWAYQTACWALVQEHGAETEAEMAERLRDFVAYLSTLNGKHRVVVAVGHGNALWTLTEHHAAEHPADDWYFRNCEVRAFVLEEK